MQALNEWFETMAGTPTGQILMFLAVFATRVMIARWSDKRRAKRARKPKAKPA